LSFLFLLAFAAAVAAFCYYNQSEVAVRFAGREVSASLAAVVGLAYVLGMLSGWTVVRTLRRSANNLAEGAEGRYSATRQATASRTAASTSRAAH
jgi:hypothetical protein